MSYFELTALRPFERAEAESTGLTAAHAEMLELAEFAQPQFKPLPPPTGAPPFRMELRDIVGQAFVERILQRKKLVFHAVGDTGQRQHGAAAQESVAFHLERQIKNSTVADADKPSLFYHLGDVVYYNGELTRYPEQFCDPYEFYPAPIVAIPGNHDCDNVPGDTSLSAFVANFCSTAPGTPPMPGHSRRQTMTQPNVYFTLKLPWATIVGLHSNNTGDLDDPATAATPQLDWLIAELRDADPGKFLIIAVHHPPFSLDDTHGGERKIGLVLDRACAAAGRLPHLVLAGHVHDYQRFSRTQSVGTTSRVIPYLVAGAGGYGGYDGLHAVMPNVPLPSGLRLMAWNDTLPGFLRITLTPTELTCHYFVVPTPPNHRSRNVPATQVDEVTVTL